MKFLLQTATYQTKSGPYGCNGDGLFLCFVWDPVVSRTNVIGLPFIHLIPFFLFPFFLSASYLSFRVSHIYVINPLAISSDLPSVIGISSSLFSRLPVFAIAHSLRSWRDFARERECERKLERSRVSEAVNMSG